MESPTAETPTIAHKLPELWVERYRPRCIDDVAHHSEIKDMLKSAKKIGELPNLIFYGPAGTGKTSMILAFAREVYGPKHWVSRVLELNASDDRGIDMVRDRVKTWSRLLASNTVLETPQTQTSGSAHMHDSTGGSPAASAKKLPPWKIILLDEADMMTTDAQSALRRIMEDTVKSTRFVLICNYLSKIIEPIASRCVKYRFQPIPAEAQYTKLKEIALCEKVRMDDSAYQRLVAISEGDLRYAINLLQTTVTAIGDKSVTADDITRAAGNPPESIAESLLRLCCKQVPLIELHSTLDQILRDGWNLNFLMRQLVTATLNEETLCEETKAQIINTISQGQMRMTRGAAEMIQFYFVMYDIHTKAGMKDADAVKTLLVKKVAAN